MRNCEVGDIAMMVNALGNTEYLGEALLIVGEYGNVIFHEQEGDAGVSLFAWQVVPITDELLSYTLQDVDRLAKQFGIVPDIFLRKFSEVVEQLGYDYDELISGHGLTKMEKQIEKGPSRKRT